MSCQICNVNPEIGVAALRTGPCSVAMCKTCVENNAEPEWAFEYLRDEVGDVADWVKELTTFKNGQYLKWEDWLALNPKPQIHIDTDPGSTLQA